MERSHRQDDQELYSRIKLRDINEFNALLEEYYLWRNQCRRFKKLGWLTANEWLRRYSSKIIKLPLRLEWKPEINQAA